MSSIQEYLAGRTEKQMGLLEAALQRIPVEKRLWQPEPTSRSALDQMAECALLNGSTVNLIATRTFPADFDMAAYVARKAEVASDEAAMLKLLHTNTAKVMEAIRAVPDADLALEVKMPWAMLTVAEVIGYPFWNMSYHEGQINYIASLLGCLE